MASLPQQFKSANDFYAHLGVGAGERKFLEKYSDYRYTQAKIPKRRGGTRTLLVPENRLKYLQRKALELLKLLYSPRIPVHGFVDKRGAITNANEHQTRPYLLNLDLRNFFGAITNARVSGMLRALGLPPDVVSAICAICVTQNQLPQGAPTSPILSNLVAYSLDKALMSFAKEHRLRYTRYADDISLSSYVIPTVLFDGGVPVSGRVPIEKLSESLRNAIKSNTFEINPDKVWFSGLNARKEVTGLIVNEFTNVKRTFVRDLRAALYKAEKFGLPFAEDEYLKKYKTKGTLEAGLRGRLEWIAQVRGRNFSAYRTLASRFNKLFPESALQILPTLEEVAERAIWVVEFFIGETSAQGTAFFLENVGLVTADHVLQELPVGAHADIYRPSEPSKKFTAKPSGRRCPTRDLLILEHDIPDTDYSSLTVATSPEHTKDDIIALGFPAFSLGDELGKRRGYINARTRRSGIKFFEVSAMLDGGISGGPIVNDRYQVVAISMRGGTGESKQLAISIAELLEFLKEPVAGAQSPEVVAEQPSPEPATSSPAPTSPAPPTTAPSAAGPPPPTTS